MRPEFRRDPLNQVWVVFSPERQRRPTDYGSPTLGVEFLDPFLGGNERLTPSEVYAVREPGGKLADWNVRVVPNRFPAVRIEGNLESMPCGIYDRVTGIGAHEVVIETPYGDRPFETLPVSQIADVLGAYRARMLDLNHDLRFKLIYVFKNVGALAGASLKHPHSQIIALPVIPNLVEAKLNRARLYFQAKERSLFSDILYTERTQEVRIVAENDGFVLFCPYASRFPFEMAILPKRHAASYADCTTPELMLLAEMLRSGLSRLSQVLENPGYNIMLHSSPLLRTAADGTVKYSSTKVDYCWHVEIIPRTAMMSGFEIGLGSYMNSVFPEEAARFLRGEVGK